MPLPSVKLDIVGQNSKKRGKGLNIKKEPVHAHSIH